VRFSTQPLHRVAAFMAQRPPREAAHLPACDALQVGPEALAGMPCWGIGGPALHLEPWRRAMGQDLGAARTAVAGRAGPEPHQRAGHRPEQGLANRHHSARVERAVLAVEVARARGGDGAARGPMVAGPPRPQEGCLADGGIRAHATRQGIEPGCIDEEERLPLGLCPLLRGGQVSARQRALAASSRCRARRAGCWGLQRHVCSKRPPWTGWEETPNARRIMVAIRPPVHPWPRKP
jgi:hypothetical protein